MLPIDSADYIARISGLKVDTIQILYLIPKYIRQNVVNILNQRIAQSKSKLYSTMFDQLRFTILVSRYEVIKNKLGDKLRPFERIMKEIPWQKYAEKSPELASLIDYLKGDLGKTGEFKKFIGLNTITSDSYDDVKQRIEEISYNLQRAIDGRTYASALRATIETKITELQRWLNALIMLDGYTSETYIFSGRIYAISAKSIYFEEGTLKVNNTTYIIKSGTINDLAVGTHYLYFDGSDYFHTTTGEETSRTGSNIRIAKITVFPVGLMQILFYGSIN